MLCRDHHLMTGKWVTSVLIQLLCLMHICFRCNIWNSILGALSYRVQTYTSPLIALSDYYINWKDHLYYAKLSTWNDYFCSTGPLHFPPQEKSGILLIFLLFHSVISSAPWQSSASKCWLAFWMKSCSKHTRHPWLQVRPAICPEGVSSGTSISASPGHTQKLKIQKGFSLTSDTNATVCWRAKGEWLKVNL